MNTNTKPHGTIDLRIVIGIAAPEDRKKDNNVRLDLMMADRVFKLKFENEEERARWQASLRE
jgi:hypothetical protein